MAENLDTTRVADDVSNALAAEKQAAEAKAAEVKAAADAKAAAEAEAAKAARDRSAGQDGKDGQDKQDAVTVDATTAALLKDAGLVVTTIDGKSVLVRETTVDGNKVLKTVAELTKDSEKISGADKRFRDASTMREENADAVQLMGLMKKTQDEQLPAAQRIAALKQVGLLLGEDPAQVETFIKEMEAGMKTDDGKGGKKDADKDQAAGADKLPPEVQEAVDDFKSRQTAERRKKIFDVVEKGVDEDLILGKLSDEESEEGKLSLRASLKQLAKNEVQRRVVAEQEEFSPELVVSVLQNLRPLAAGLAQPKASEVIDQLPDEVREMLNLGEAAGGAPQLQAAGAGSGSPNSSGDDQQRVPITDPNWSADFMAGVKREQARLDQAAQRRGE